MDSTWIIIGIGAFIFFGGIFTYMLLMIFYPELVGITGKAAREAQESHKGGKAYEDKFDSNLDKWQK